MQFIIKSVGGPGQLIKINNYFIKHDNQGFTLIESLIALIILGIVMAGSMTFFAYASALHYKGVHAKMATWIADSELEVIKSATGCSNAPTTGPAGNSVTIDKLTGALKITWPATPTSDPCSATTTKPACTSPTEVGVCVTWAEPGNLANSSNVGLVTYVGS